MTTVLAVLAVGMFVAEEKKDTDKLQGTWMLEAVERGGKKTPAAEEQHAPKKLVFAGDMVTLSGGGQDFQAKLTGGRVGASGTIDMVADEGPRKETPLHGLHRLA